MAVAIDVRMQRRRMEKYNLSQTQEIKIYKSDPKFKWTNQKTKIQKKR